MVAVHRLRSRGAGRSRRGPSSARRDTHAWPVAGETRRAPDRPRVRHAGGAARRADRVRSVPFAGGPAQIDQRNGPGPETRPAWRGRSGPRPRTGFFGTWVAGHLFEQQAQPGASPASSPRHATAAGGGEDRSGASHPSTRPDSGGGRPRTPRPAAGHLFGIRAAWTGGPARTKSGPSPNTTGGRGSLGNPDVHSERKERDPGKTGPRAEAGGPSALRVPGQRRGSKNTRPSRSVCGCPGRRFRAKTAQTTRGCSRPPRCWVNRGPARPAAVVVLERFCRAGC